MAIVEISAASVATVVLIKLSEKIGNNLGDTVSEQADKLFQLLKIKFLSTANAIEKVAINPQLVEQQPLDYSQAVLAQQIQEATEKDEEIAEAVQTIENLVKCNPKTAQVVEENWQGINIKGGSPEINNSTFNFNK